MTKVSASILACNLLEIANGVRTVEQAGADFIHIDIMDGDYVENLTYGPQLIADLKKFTHLPLEVHLELFRPDKYIDMFVSVGTDRIIVQRDSCLNPLRVLRKIHDHGIEAGIALNPAEDVSLLKYLLPYIDFVVIMSVEPGFGGQPFENSCFQKIVELRRMMEECQKSCPIMVDGGINLDNAQKLVSVGANALVIGTSLFKSENVANTVHMFKSIE